MLKVKFARTSACELSEIISEGGFATVQQVLDDINNEFNATLSAQDVASLDDTYIESLPSAVKAAMLVQDIEVIGMSIAMPAQLAAQLAVKQAVEAARNAQAATATVQAFVTVSYGAGIGAPQNIAVIAGVTTVEDVVFSATVQALTNKNTTQLRNCRITVSGAPIALTATLTGGEAIRIEQRVAGDKGCDGVMVRFTAADGTLLATWQIAEGLTLDDFDDSFDAAALLDHINTNTDYRVQDILGATTSIAGVSDMLGTLKEHMVLFDGCTVCLGNADRVAITDTIETRSYEECHCTVSQGAGISPIVVPFAVGACVQDVILDPTVLFKLHQSREDVERCNISINGTRCCMTSELRDNDQIRIEARVAGDKGNA